MLSDDEEEKAFEDIDLDTVTEEDNDSEDDYSDNG